MNKEISEAISLCIDRNIPFVAFRCPNEKEIYFWSAPSIILNKEILDAECSFFIGKFNTPFQQSIVIPYEWNATETLALGKNLYFPEASISYAASTFREDYLEKIKVLIERLKLRRDAKTVFSKIYLGYMQGNKAIDGFHCLLQNGPSLFCSLYYHPLIGLGMGATPELLLESDLKNGNFHTMALAGTRLRSEDWDEKNVKEHCIVADYIFKRLLGLGLEFKYGKMHDVGFGKLKHLCTEFEGQMGYCSYEKLIDTLNPTPALCGYPLDQSIQDIEELEDTPRHCYGGVIGYKSKTKAKAYVNIRCVNFDQSRYCMRTGGGIMPQSDPYDEWKEAESKRMALLELLNWQA